MGLCLTSDESTKTEEIDADFRLLISYSLGVMKRNIEINTCSNRTHTSILQKNVQRCRDGNVCEVYVIPFLFGSFFTVYHPYIDVHFFKCFFC